MSKKYGWYWGCEKPASKNFILVDIILDNFDNKKYQKKHTYLKKHVSNLSNEIVNLRNFFEKINEILVTSKSKKEKINKISNLRDVNKNKFISPEVAEVIINNLEFNYNKKNKHMKGGSKVKDIVRVKDDLKLNYKILKKYILLDYEQKQLGGFINSNSILEDQYARFREINKKYGDTQFENKLKNIINLNKIPKIFGEYTKHEYSIPLNLNDILLIGFSLLPNIGWILDIFMILRSLIEKRYIYAILMTINCYQYLFNKIISLGLMGIDFGPIIKMFYIAPYANKNFNLQNIKLKLYFFFESINININKELLVN